MNVLAMRLEDMFFKKKEHAQPSGIIKLIHILEHMDFSDPHSEKKLYTSIMRELEKIPPSAIDPTLKTNLKTILYFRYLIFCEPESESDIMLKILIYNNKSLSKKILHSLFALPISSKKISEHAKKIAKLYWTTFQQTQTSNPLKKISLRIIEYLFTTKHSFTQLFKLMNELEVEDGMLYFILNCFESIPSERINEWLYGLLQEKDLPQSSRDVLRTLYWMHQLHWFTSHEGPDILDYETASRYIYHIMMTNPERAGFLEIDSPFFSEFAMMNEKAQEGLAFRELLIENILYYWRQSDLFNTIFKDSLSILTNTKNKILDNFENWNIHWQQEQEAFGKDYLYLIEGNFSFIQGYYEDAEKFYLQSLHINKNLRASQINLLFTYAYLSVEKFYEARKTLMGIKNLGPLFYLSMLHAELKMHENFIAKKRETSILSLEEKFHDLIVSSYPSYSMDTLYLHESKYYLEEGNFEKSFEYIKKAYAINPLSQKINIQFSLCLYFMGRVHEALTLAQPFIENNNEPWHKFYKFVLQKDNNLTTDALKTLYEIPTDFFNQEELHTAMEFAKSKKNIPLLLHLKSKKN